LPWLIHEVYADSAYANKKNDEKLGQQNNLFKNIHPSFKIVTHGNKLRSSFVSF
jgi:hypothetical protein